MNETEYRALLDNIAALSDGMKELGETHADWTEDQRSQWDEMETAYNQAIQQKAEEDERRHAAAVEDKLSQLQKPPSRALSVPQRQLAVADRTPDTADQLVAFRGEKAADKAYDFGLWMRAVVWEDKESAERYQRRQNLSSWEQRQQIIGTPSAGGYTVPKPLASTFLQVLNEYGAARRVSRIMPMTANTLDVAKKISGQTVYYPGEANAITASETVWGNVTLTAVKRATLTKVSNELISDSIITFAEEVARQAAYEIAFNQDREFILGDGGPTYGNVSGLTTAIGSAGINTATANSWAGLTIDDFHATKAKLPSRFYMGNNLYWIMKQEFFSAVVEPIVYAAGGNTLSIVSGRSIPSLFGIPVVFSDHMPDDGADAFCCFLGNFYESVLLGQRTDIDIRRSDDFAFDEDVTTIRVTTRYDIKVHEPGDASNAGGYVALKTAVV